MTPARIGRIISEIGKRAGVVVRKAEGKFASAHDLRRSFGTRWAPRVKPATLQLSCGTGPSRRRSSTTWPRTPMRLPTSYGRAFRRKMRQRPLRTRICRPKDDGFGTLLAQSRQRGAETRKGFRRANRRNPLSISKLRKRRARDSNPQPVARHLISSLLTPCLGHAILVLR